ncbi:hypothetical protein [Streptomyces sp. NBC_00842]|uniref:hypothetical protein n=1 Tax=Streptomyces sp. NBC_00842 TaxID=2975848 RepID=UPI0038652768|nr:hypothetical protein OH821_18855 [Streptomyces sp. NBC_00842]
MPGPCRRRCDHSHASGGQATPGGPGNHPVSDHAVTRAHHPATVEQYALHPQRDGNLSPADPYKHLRWCARRHDVALAQRGHRYVSALIAHFS